MPRFATTMTFARRLAEVFDFFRRPANLLQANPPDLHLQLVEAPEVLQKGSRVVLQAKRFGMAQRLVSEVTTLQQDVLLVDEQREGPFRRWVQTHRFEQQPEGTRVTFEIDYETPGGLLGLVLTTAAVEKELQALFAYRARKLQELLGTIT